MKYPLIQQEKYFQEFLTLRQFSIFDQTYFEEFAVILHVSTVAV